MFACFVAFCEHRHRSLQIQAGLPSKKEMADLSDGIRHRFRYESIATHYRAPTDPMTAGTAFSICPRNRRAISAGGILCRGGTLFRRMPPRDPLP